jgi:hypothetical protein
MTDLLLIIELREGRLKDAAVKTSRTNHHLLNHPPENDVQCSHTKGSIHINRPCLSIEIAEFTVLRLNLPRIDLRMMSENILPPLHLVHFLEMKLDG